MKTELASLELHYLVEELQELKGARVSKVYQPDKESLLFQLHTSGKGKSLLRITLPSVMFVTDFKGNQPSTPLGFCMFLRKYLTGAKINSISQRESERIVEFVFITKEKEYSLFVELFSKGNIILCENNKILSPLKMQKWKDRIVKKGEEYTYPKREYNIFELKKKELLELSKKTNKDSVVKMLATDLGLGGTYAEELCLLAGIDKKQKEFDAGKIIETLEKLISKKQAANIVSKDNVIFDVVPFHLRIYKNLEAKNFNTFGEALDSYFTTGIKQKIRSKSNNKFERKIQELERVIKEQKDHAREMEQSIKDNTGKGELFYEKYELIGKMLDELKKARKTHSWNEIKKKLKDHKLIKQVNEKSKTITAEF